MVLRVSVYSVGLPPEFGTPRRKRNCCNLRHLQLRFDFFIPRRAALSSLCAHPMTPRTWLSLALVLVLACQAHAQAPTCATRCHEVDCDAFSIRYGKFCGVGHGGR